MANSSGLWITSDGYDRLEYYLTSLYGERGSYKTNLELYLAHPIHSCRTYSVSSSADILEISERDIRTTICRMDQINMQVANMVSEFDSYKGRVPDDVCLDMAQRMGLCPSEISSIDTFFPFVMNFQRETQDNLKEMLEAAKKKPKVISVMVSAMMDGIRRGNIVNYKGRLVWSQGYARNFYRGENAYYGRVNFIIVFLWAEEILTV